MTNWEQVQETVSWDPVRVEQEIYRCVQRIEVGVRRCDEAYREFHKADREFDLAEAKAYLRARDDGLPAHACGYEATIATIDERATRDAAEEVYKLCDRQMKALMAELDALRSIGTSVRQAYAEAGRGSV